jgi:hypothetical protein
VTAASASASAADATATATARYERLFARLARCLRDAAVADAPSFRSQTDAALAQFASMPGALIAACRLPSFAACMRLLGSDGARAGIALKLLQSHADSTDNCITTAASATAALELVRAAFVHSASRASPDALLALLAHFIRTTTPPPAAEATILSGLRDAVWAVPGGYRLLVRHALGRLATTGAAAVPAAAGMALFAFAMLTIVIIQAEDEASALSLAAWALVVAGARSELADPASRLVGFCRRAIKETDFGLAGTAEDQAELILRLILFELIPAAAAFPGVAGDPPLLCVRQIADAIAENTTFPDGGLLRVKLFLDIAAEIIDPSGVIAVSCVPDSRALALKVATGLLGAVLDGLDAVATAGCSVASSASEASRLLADLATLDGCDAARVEILAKRAAACSQVQ